MNIKKTKTAKALVFKPEFRSRVVRDRTTYQRSQKHKNEDKDGNFQK